MIKVKNWTIDVVSKIRNGFEAVVSNQYGEYMTVQFSDITLKFYLAEGKQLKMPAYLMKELLAAAQKKTFILLDEIDVSNAITMNKDGKYKSLH